MKALNHLLLVEDDDADIELIQVALAEHILIEHIEVVNDGAAALDYLKFEGIFSTRSKAYPEIIIMDLKMPKMNGIEVLQQIKSHPLLQSIPILILSSSNEPKDLVAAQELNAKKYIVKEVGFHSLIDAVQQYLNGSLFCQEIHVANLKST